MNKPPNTLVDRPSHRDWTIWLAGIFVAVAQLWDVVDIYVVDRGIYRVLGLQGSIMTLLAELLLAAMTATFIVVVLTTTRRAVRSWRYQHYLTRNVTILASPAAERRPSGSHSPNESLIPLEGPGEANGTHEHLPSPRRIQAPARLRFGQDRTATATRSERGLPGRS